MVGRLVTNIGPTRTNYLKSKVIDRKWRIYKNKDGQTNKNLVNHKYRKTTIKDKICKVKDVAKTDENFL